MSDKKIIVLATRNKGKTEEIKALLKDYPVELKNLDDFGPIPDVVEDGETFDDNAYKKASFTSRILGLPAMADDSGLIVSALDGAPGVYSARYAGEGANDADNNEKLLKDMSGKDDRSAAFECVISIAIPTGPALTYSGRCEGRLLDKPEGEKGFGYDPLFFCEEFGKTFAQLSLEEKSKVSHRGNALKEVQKEFDKILIWIEQNMPRFEKNGCTGGC